MGFRAEMLSMATREREGPSTGRLLVAIYIESDREGLECLATDEELAGLSGMSVGMVRHALAWMERAGWVATLTVPPPRPNPGRKLVLMDHPAADWYVTETRRVIGSGAVSAGELSGG